MAGPFQEVSDGRGHVPEHVWRNISEMDQTADWLGHEPSDIEA